MAQKIDDEKLMAFADGELNDKQMLEVENALNKDPVLAERMGMYLETGKLLKEAGDYLLETPVPDVLRKNVEQMLTDAESLENAAKPHGFRLTTARQEESIKLPIAANSNWYPAIAASIALIVGSLIGYGVAGIDTSSDSEQLQIADFGQLPITNALYTVPSGEELDLGENGERFRAIASYNNQSGALCREFELDKADKSTFVSVACHKDMGWRLTFTVAAMSQSDDGYAPASSLEALDSYLDAVGIDNALSLEAETEALNKIK